MDLDIVLHKYSFQFTRNIFLYAWRSITIFTRVCWESKIWTVILRSVKIMLEDLILSSTDLSEIHDFVSLIIFENFTQTLYVPVPQKLPRTTIYQYRLVDLTEDNFLHGKVRMNKDVTTAERLLLAVDHRRGVRKTNKAEKVLKQTSAAKEEKSSPFIQNYVESLKEDTFLQTKSAVISA